MPCRPLRLSGSHPKSVPNQGAQETVPPALRAQLRPQRSTRQAVRGLQLPSGSSSEGATPRLPAYWRLPASSVLTLSLIERPCGNQAIFYPVFFTGRNENAAAETLQRQRGRGFGNRKELLLPRERRAPWIPAQPLMLPSGPKLPVPPTCRRGCAPDKGTFLRGSQRGRLRLLPAETGRRVRPFLPLPSSWPLDCLQRSGIFAPTPLFACLHLHLCVISQICWV